MRVDTPPIGGPNAAPAPPAVHCRLLGAVDVRNAAGEEVRALLVQPKRLALFTYLVLRGAGRMPRRDSLLALFWPEASAGAARHSLRQALHGVRQALGPDVLVSRGRDEIGAAAGRVWCEAAEFERAVAERRHVDALALHGGPLLDGSHVAAGSESHERERSAEATRGCGLLSGTRARTCSPARGPRRRRI